MQVRKILAAIAIIGCWFTLSLAQAPLPVPQAPPPGQQVPLPQATIPVPGAAPTFPPEELERITSPIALYPDPLLAQVLAAATYADQIPDAARWADEHHYLSGPALVAAMNADQLPWDPSIQALLPFPSVLDMGAGLEYWDPREVDPRSSQQRERGHSGNDAHPPIWRHPGSDQHKSPPPEPAPEAGPDTKRLAK